MYNKATAVLAITACLLVAAYAEQGLMDCRKLVYSRNCRGVAAKRSDLQNEQTRSENLRSGLSLKRLIYDLGSSTGYPPAENAPFIDKLRASGESGLQKEKQQLNHLLFELLSNNNRKISDNDNFPSYEY